MRETKEWREGRRREREMIGAEKSSVGLMLHSY
jgi:hypothetical protein